jgi:hypothetical protein
MQRAKALSVCHKMSLHASPTSCTQLSRRPNTVSTVRSTVSTGTFSEIVRRHGCADAAKLVEQLCGAVFGTPQDSHELGILPINCYDWTWQYADVSERACLPKQFELKRQTSFFSSRGVRAISIQTAAIASMMIVVDASAAGRRTRRPTPPRPATDASRSLQSVRDRRICPWHASLRLAAQHTCAPLRGNGFGTPRAFVAKRRVWCHSGVDAGGLAVADA